VDRWLAAPVIATREGGHEHRTGLWMAEDLDVDLGFVIVPPMAPVAGIAPVGLYGLRCFRSDQLRARRSGELGPLELLGDDRRRQRGVARPIALTTVELGGEQDVASLDDALGIPLVHTRISRIAGEAGDHGEARHCGLAGRTH